MSYASLTALLEAFPDEASLADEKAVKAIALFDHEEVGSASAQGSIPTLPISFPTSPNLFYVSVVESVHWCWPLLSLLLKAWPRISFR
jgi:hypothetical protein